MFSEVINYFSIRLGDIPITTLISSSALIALFIFLVNEYKERHRFQLYCRILYQEVELHQYWIDALNDGIFDVSELLLSESSSKDWDKLKYDPVLLRIQKKDFDLLLKHYLNLRTLQLVIRKSIQHKIFVISPSILKEKYATSQEVLKVLEKLAGIKKDTKNNQN